MSVDLEEVKQILRENALEMAELREAQEKSHEEADRRFQEADRQMREVRESQKETGRLLRDLQTKMEGLGLNIGHAAEEFFQTALAKNLNFAGVQFDEMLANVGKTRGGKSCEFDIVLVNHDAVAIIEAKHRVRKAFPEEMAVEKVAAFRSLFPEYKDYKLYLGIAGFSMDGEVEDEAKRLGIGLLKQDGDAVKTVDIPLKPY
ncbi:MAG: hypothetical protein MdMp014T_0953 [Treponematales bacterium]